MAAAMPAQRRLTAILAADRPGVAGPQPLIDAAIERHHGRVCEPAEIALLVEFTSVVDAARCALALGDFGAASGIGLHLGDVEIVTDGVLRGDNVKLACGLGAMAERGRIYLSGAAYEQVRDKLDCGFVGLGEHRLPGIARPVAIFAIAIGTEPQRRLSIIVLPLVNIGNDRAQEHFVDGITESLTTDLSRIKGSFVIGRSTAFAYKGKPVELKQLGRELGVRYVLEGSVQCRGVRMRVNIQLIDAGTGSHLWAERFNKTIADLFDLQDEIVARLANQLAAELIAVEARRAARAPHPNSMDRYFQGQAKFHEGRSPAQLAIARGFFEQALALDSGNLEALVGRAFCDFMAGSSHMADDRDVLLRVAEASLVQALRAAPAHGLALTLLGAVHIVTNRADEGIAECQRALALDRNLAIAHSFVALAKSYVGRSEETEADMLEALRLSPRDINVFIWLFCVGLAKLYLGADLAAVDWCQRSIETNRNFPLSHFVLAAALAALDRLEEAQSAVASGLALDPSFTIERYRQGTASDHSVYLAQRERIYQLMRLAGVPSGGS